MFAAALILLLSLLQPASVIASGLPSPEEMNHNIVGEWEAKTEDRIARVMIDESGHFSGVIGKNGKVLWLFSGSWVIRGKELIWFYDQAVGQDAKIDKNAILSLSSEILVLLETNGKITRYFRK